MLIVRVKKWRMLLSVLSVFVLLLMIVCMNFGWSKEEIQDSMRQPGLTSTCQFLTCKDKAECDYLKIREHSRVKEIIEDLNDNKCSPHLRGEYFASKREQAMPLAFSIMAHRDLPQLIRLLEAVYRPHNVYCIQIDNKSDPKFWRNVKTLLSCLGGDTKNRFISTRNISLVWQHSSLLEGDVSCLEQLLESSQPWNYYVNIVGSEYPLMTNIELVRRLESANNDVGFVHIGFPHPGVDVRWNYSHVLIDEDSKIFYKAKVKQLETLKSPPPQGLQILYGLKNAALSRSFSEYCIHSEIAKELRTWMLDVQSPEEHFYQTLAFKYLLDLGYESDKIIQLLNGLEMRRTLWSKNIDKCYGKVKREICILTISDLPTFLQLKGFVMNKFETEVDFTVVECLHEILYG